jgi:hypothetical protein
MFCHRPLFRHCFECVRGNALSISRRVLVCLRCRLTPVVASRLLLIALCVLLTGERAWAGFCLGAGSVSTHPSTVSEGVTYSVLKLAEPFLESVGQKSGCSSESDSAAAMPDSPDRPNPLGSRLGQLWALSGVGGSADFSGNSRGSSSGSSGGTASGTAVFAKPSSIQMPLLIYWQRERESVFIPAAPSSDVFRPPPVTTLASCV